MIKSLSALLCVFHFLRISFSDSAMFRLRSFSRFMSLEKSLWSFGDMLHDLTISFRP